MEDRIHGIGFTIRTALIKNLLVSPVGINKRLMKLRMPIGKSRHLTITSACAPTLTSSYDVKEEFYGNLDHVRKITPQSDKLVPLGHFNARVERDQSSWAGVLRKHGIGKVNDKGLLLLSKCSEHSLFYQQLYSKWPTSTRLLG